MIDLFAALIIDFFIGDPYWLPHPIRLMGKLIAIEEKTARKISKSNSSLRAFGFAIVIMNIIISFTIPFFILKTLKPYGLTYHIVNTYFIYTCVAGGCLRNEALKIYHSFSNGIEDARYKLSFIVGRDTKSLSEKEIIRATVETVAENTSDGVIAPMLYAIIGGAPLAFVYKMVNTMDSMLGYMNEKYIYIGFFPAKTDDVFNYIPSRLTGVLMCLSSFLRFDTLEGLKIMIRDRKNHKSPNCAYPEGAAAGLLNIQLGGDNYYFGELVKKPKIGDKINELKIKHIKNTVEIMFRAEVLLAVLYLVIEVVL